jgi:uncharacterized protein with von Willebrand factor type A (vWA) domain
MSWYDKFKTGTKDNLTKKSASSYWYDEYDTSYDYLDKYTDWATTTNYTAYKKTNDLYKLSSVRRAISNFVQIVTQKNIPVTFATKSDSKTDGERVILSADVDDNFDVSVGLALHEGSHIVLSDFKLLKAMSEVKDRIYWDKRGIADANAKSVEEGLPLAYPDLDSVDSLIKRTISNHTKYTTQLSEIYLSTGKIGKYGIPPNEVIDIISGLTNWVEDRRIDMFIYKSAPGYREYYTSMYDHYFNDKIVTKGIKSDEFTEETFESYMFRIINLMNESSDLSKLKGLRAIYRSLKLNDIARLKNSTDSLDLAIDIVAEILKYVPYTKEGDLNKQQSASGQSNGEQDEESQEGEGQGQSGDEENNDSGNGIGMNPDGINGEQSDSNSNADAAPTAGDVNGKDMLSKSALQQLAKKFQKQKDFINGNIKKKNVTKTELDKLKDIQESGTELVRVGGDYERNGNRVGKGVDCIVVKQLTDKLTESDDFPFTGKDWQTRQPHRRFEEEVRKGINLGIILGKKLQIRNESRETVFSRLKKGKIDGRMIASLGYDNENVFYTNEVDQFKKGNLHISIDYSGSMSGDKLRRAITSTVAIVKACQMARNINVQVSARSTDSGQRQLPYIVMVYDSRKNSLKDFYKYMSMLQAHNTTPEGLCFEAIQKYLIPTSNDTDSYFLNFSDGQPCYSISHGTDDINYSGFAAAEHTNKQVKKMQASGINVLSYFITDMSEDRFERSSDWEIFKKCYGKDAKYVNVENMMQVAKTMNEMFLTKI